jgi:predicted dehydrogenase
VARTPTVGDSGRVRRRSRRRTVRPKSYALDAVAAGEAPAFNTVEQALTVQRVIDGIYRSAERGECVSIGE